MVKKFTATNIETPVAELLRKVVTLLNEQSDIIRGGLFHTLPGSMNDRITTMGVMNIAHFVLFMQEIGLLRKWGGGGAVVWQVICLTFFDEVVTNEWLERSQVRLQKHIDSTEELRLLKVRVGELEKVGVPDTPVGEQSLNEIAATMVDLEQLRKRVNEQTTRIADLERALAERPAFDADAALAAAIKRARGSNAM